MNSLIIFGLLAAGAVGWCAGRLVPRRYDKQLAKRLEESSEVSERYMMGTSMANCTVLSMLESGDIPGAKAQLSKDVAFIYCSKQEFRRDMEELGLAPGWSDFTKLALSSIEKDAERFEVLRLAIEKEKLGEVDPDSEIRQLLKELKGKA